MELGIQELGPWNGSTALIIDGGSGPSGRPPVHLQAADGGYLRLVGPDGPVLWGLVQRGWWGVDLVRAKHTTVHALPPLRAHELERAPGAAGSPEFVGWWTRRYAALLRASSSTPLAHGRRYLLAPVDSLESPRPIAHASRRDLLDDLRAQREEFAFPWDFTGHGLLLMRPLSDASDGRVKMWRKRARDGRLPPLVTWWCRGLFAHVVLDGHDRVHAALLEGFEPDIVALADACARPRREVEARQRNALDRAASLESRIPPVGRRASEMNRQLQPGWDPRAEWDLATPGFPLEGGVEQWKQEVRGTALATALSKHRTAPAELGEP